MLMLMVLTVLLFMQVRMSELRGDLGIQPRDLRLLDPTFSKSYPSAILVRGSAILVKMEYIKCIITTDCVLLLGADQVQPTPHGHLADICATTFDRERSACC